MIALIQRATRGSVRVDGERVGEIGPGLVCLIGVGQGDGAAQRATATQPATTRSANPERRGGSSSGYTRGGSASSLAGGVDQDALLSRIIDDNVRLRESLKRH